MEFEPERLSFEDGQKRIQKAAEKSRLNVRDRIVTSQDRDVSDVRDELRMGGLPQGFSMEQLPLALSKVLFFTGAAQPNAEMPRHRHSHPVLRVVLSGSITFEDKELTAGDWMFIPAGKEYSFRAGPSGATFLYPHGESM